MFTTRLRNIRKKVLKLEKKQDKTIILTIQILLLFVEYIETLEKEKKN